MNELFLKDFDSDENDEEYVPDKKEIEDIDLNVDQIKTPVNANKIDEIWLKLKGSNKIEDSYKNKEINISDSKLSTSVDEEIMKAISKNKEIQNNIIKETVRFAGKKFEYKKTVTEEDIKKKNIQEKKKTHSGLDNIMQMIDKKNNVNTYTKTKKDWSNYVEEKKLEKELDYNRKDGFLKKKQFIEETNIKLIENKKNLKRHKSDH